jgi:hypothetical protein
MVSLPRSWLARHTPSPPVHGQRVRQVCSLFPVPCSQFPVPCSLFPVDLDPASCRVQAREGPQVGLVVVLHNSDAVSVHRKSRTRSGGPVIENKK